VVRSALGQVNAPLPGGPSGAVTSQATPLTVAIQNQQGQTIGTGTTDIIPFAKSQPAGGGPAIQSGCRQIIG
jgi:hypothetical protein